MARQNRRGRGQGRGIKANRMGPMGAGPGMMGPGMMGPGMMRQGGDHAMMMAEMATLGVRLYAPPMLIHRASEIGLTPDQITRIRQEMVATHSKSIDLRARIEHAKLETARLLAADKVDEKAVNAQIDEAAKSEAELHKLHLGMMLRTRALLTPEQRQKLDAPKPKGEPGREKPGAGPMSQAEDCDDDDDADDDDDCDDDDDDEVGG